MTSREDKDELTGTLTHFLFPQPFGFTALQLGT